MVEIVCLNTKCKFYKSVARCKFVVHPDQYFVIDRNGKCNYCKLQED